MNKPTPLFTLRSQASFKLFFEIGVACLIVIFFVLSQPEPLMFSFFIFMTLPLLLKLYIDQNTVIYLENGYVYAATPLFHHLEKKYRKHVPVEEINSFEWTYVNTKHARSQYLLINCVTAFWKTRFSLYEEVSIRTGIIALKNAYPHIRLDDYIEAFIFDPVKYMELLTKRFEDDDQKFGIKVVIGGIIAAILFLLKNYFFK